MELLTRTEIVSGILLLFLATAAIFAATAVGPAYLVFLFFWTTVSEGQKIVYAKRSNIIFGILTMVIVPLYVLLKVLLNCSFNIECLSKPILSEPNYKLIVSLTAMIFGVLGLGICQRIEFDISGRENVTGIRKMWLAYPKLAGAMTALAALFGTYDPNFFALAGLFFALLAPLESSYKKWAA